jgi:microcystin degradation protein MlrC
MTNGDRPRILVAYFVLEANSFVPGATTLDTFAAQGLMFGSYLRREKIPSSKELAAAWDALAAAGAEIVPTVYADATAKPPMTTIAFETIRDAIVEAADDSIDGVYLALHGAALAEEEDDPEGAIIEAVRSRLGPGRPIAVSLDHHATMTQRMAENADIFTAYRTCPHVDLDRTARQAVELLLRTLRGEIRPVVEVVHRPMIAPADVQDNRLEPFGSLMRMCDEAEARPGVLAATLMPAHAWRDIPTLSWHAAVTADGDRALARREATRIADAAWKHRHAFVSGSRSPIAEALATALAGPAPYVIADAGDALTGGSPGDSTELLRAALPHRDRRIWLTVRDEPAAQAAAEAGVGAEVDVALGSGAAGAYNERTAVRARVESVPTAPFAYTVPYAQGVRGHLGVAATLAVDELRIVVHSGDILLLDPAPYAAAGLVPAEAEVLQAKSHVSYRAGFEQTTSRSVVADTPGPTAADVRLLPYVRRPRPLFPFEDPGDDLGGAAASSGEQGPAT